MAKPMQEAKWQMEKVVNLVAELSAELDEAEYRLGEVEEVNTDEIASLAQQAIQELENADMGDEEAVHQSMMNALKALNGILKELEK